MTDSMGMGAISGSTRNIAAASVQAVLAGEDVLLVTSPGTAQAAYDGLLNAVRSGQITEERINESLRSILETKAGWGLLSGSPSAATIPDWKANANLSFDAGYRAVTLFRDQPGYAAHTGCQL
jgi:beta-N-acetylhexosaminidase